MKRLKAHNLVWQGCFYLSILSRNFNVQLSSSFHRFVILCICWDTPSARTGLWQSCQRCPMSLMGNSHKDSSNEHWLTLNGLGNSGLFHRKYKSPIIEVRTNPQVTNEKQLMSFLMSLEAMKISANANWNKEKKTNIIAIVWKLVPSLRKDYQRPKLD